MSIPSGTAQVGDRQFLNIGGHAIPVDSIVDIDYDAPNGGSTNCVCIHTTQDDFYYNYADADALRVFFNAPSLDQLHRWRSRLDGA